MITNVLLIVAALIAVVLLIAYFKSSEFRVARSATINAPAAVVFAHVNTLQKWDDWSPWAKIDPNMKKSYEGPAAGVGAVHAWCGNGKVGAGRMTITDSRPNEFLRFKLEFLKPFAATNTAEFTFQSQGGQTLVTWSMSGHSHFVCRVMGVFMNMDKMCGDQFAKGLAQLKTIAEQPGSGDWRQATGQTLIRA